MSEARIRRATEADWPAVLAMSNALVDEGCLNGMVYDTVARFAGQTIFLAEADGRSVGYAYGRRTAAEPDTGGWCEEDEFFSLEEIYVLPAYRSRGIGSALFDALRREALRQGCAVLHLTAVNPDWQRSLRFYCDQQHMKMWYASLYLDLAADEPPEE